MEEQLRQLIEQAKATNNIELVEQLTQALNTCITQKKQEEEKKSEEDIKKIEAGEVSETITTKSNNHITDSKYFDIKPNTKNSDLLEDLSHILAILAFDDINKTNNATAKLQKIIDTYQNPEDVNTIQTFLNDIAKVGHAGLEAKESIINNQNNNQEKESIINNHDDNRKKEIFNRYFDSEYDKEKKNADFLDIELDELGGKSNKNPTDYEEIISRYNFLIQRLERLYYTTEHKVSPEKSQKLAVTIKYLKGKVTNIKKYHIALKEAIDETNRLFEY